MPPVEIAESFLNLSCLFLYYIILFSDSVLLKGKGTGLRFSFYFMLVLTLLLFSSGHVGSEDAAQVWTAMRIDMQTLGNRVARSSGGDKEAFQQLTAGLKQFIRSYPDAPEAAEAYYLLGEGYLNAGFESEGMANLQIAAQKFPESPWAEEALMALLRYMEKSGGKGKNEAFYRDLIKKYPNSKAGRIAIIASGMERLAKGQKAKVSLELENMEKDNPNLFLEVPMALDLKARILSMDGKEEEARALWLQYLNLASSKSAKTQTIFNIAESFFREKQWVQARKYYGLLVTGYPDARELSLARFRLLAIDELAGKELSGLGARPREISPEKKEETLQAVLNGNASLSLTQEAYLELLRLRLKNGQFLEFLTKAEEFERKWPKSPYMEELVGLMKQAESLILAQDFGTQDALDILSFGQGYLASHSKAQLLPSFLWITQGVWLKLAQNLLNSKDYESAIANASGLASFAKDPDTKAKAVALEQEARLAWIAFLMQNNDYENAILRAEEAFRAFPDTQTGHKALELGKKALNEFMAESLKQNGQLPALNFYYNHKDELAPLLTPDAVFQMGRLWRGIACPHAAQRAFFQAWLKNGRKLWPELFYEWVSIAIEQAEIQEADALFSMFARQHPKELNALYWLTKARSARMAQDWKEVSAAAQKALSLGAKDETEAKRLWFDAAINLGQWPEAQAVWLGMEQGLEPDVKAGLLKAWGDAAILAGAFNEAVYPYKALLDMKGDDPAVLARNGVVSYMIGDERNAVKYLEAARKDAGLWGKMAGAVLDTQTFLKENNAR